MTGPSAKTLEHLTGLGLNQLEARVYAFLLARPPMTAYKIAQGLGVAAANVYKAVESLSRQGAVLVESGGNRSCRAVPAAEFLGHLERGYRERTRRAEEALARIERETPDEGWYKIESVAQMLERARDMLAQRAERSAVVDAFPRILERIRPAIEAAVARGVEVRVQAYEPVSIPGAMVVVPDMSGAAMNLWKSEQLNLVIDGRECIVALVDRALETVYQGIWSRSLYLSCILFAGIRGEHTIHRLRQCRGTRNENKRWKEILDSHSFFVDGAVPGQKELLERFLEQPREGDS